MGIGRKRLPIPGEDALHVFGRILNRVYNLNVLLRFIAFDWCCFESVSCSRFTDNVSGLGILGERCAIALPAACFLIQFFGAAPKQRSRHLLCGMGLGSLVAALILNRLRKILSDRLSVNSPSHWLRVAEET